MSDMIHHGRAMGRIVGSKRFVLAIAGALGLLTLGATPAQAESKFRIGVEINSERGYHHDRHDHRHHPRHEPVARRYEAQRVWVAPVYRTVCERVWVEPTYTTCDERVWVPERVVQWREVTYGSGAYQRVEREPYRVEPGHYETQARRVEATPGRWEEVTRQELVSPGYWATVEPGYGRPDHYDRRENRWRY